MITAMQSVDFRARVASVWRVALVLACVFGSLGLVAWRQTRASMHLREINQLQREIDIVRAEIATLQRRLQRLQSRGYIMEVAGSRLGMRLPESDEILLLPDPTEP